MVPHTFHWPQTPFDSTWKLLKRINMLDLNPRETKPCLWLRAVTYDVSDWIAAVRSPRVISVSLNSVTLGQCLVINWTVCQLELKRKQKWANVFEFFLPLLRWLQWKIHLPPDHIIIITIGNAKREDVVNANLAFTTSSRPHEIFLSSGGIEMPMSQLIINLNSGCIHWQCQPGSSLYCDPWVVPLCIKDSIY